MIKSLIITIFIISSAYASSISHKDFILSLKQQIDNAFIKKSKKNCSKELYTIVQHSIDFKNISKFVMGKYYALVPEQVRQDFLQEYKLYFTHLCIQILCKYVSNKGEMLIIGTKKIDNAVYLIYTRIPYGESDGFINIDFKVTQDGYSFLISDIIMSGTSITISQRSIFNEKFDMYGMTDVLKKLKSDNSLNISDQ